MHFHRHNEIIGKSVFFKRQFSKWVVTREMWFLMDLDDSLSMTVLLRLSHNLRSYLIAFELLMQPLHLQSLTQSEDKSLMKIKMRKNLTMLMKKKVTLWNIYGVWNVSSTVLRILQGTFILQRNRNCMSFIFLRYSRMTMFRMILW